MNHVRHKSVFTRKSTFKSSEGVLKMITKMFDAIEESLK